MSEPTGHDGPAPDPAKAGSPARGVVRASLALLFLETGLLLLATRYGQPSWALAGHLAAMAGLGFWILRRWRRAEDIRPHLLLGATAPFLGPLAAAGVLLQVACARRFARSAMPLEEWYARLFPEPKGDAGLSFHAQARRTAEDIRIPAGPTPFADVMIAGALEQKQALLTLAGRDFRPIFAPVLQRALHDENNAIRVQAAATIAKVEAQHHRRVEELSAAIVAHPDDDESRRELARRHGEHSTIGWLDATRQEECRQQALRLYGECLRRRPADAEVHLAIGGLHLHAGRVAEAARWFEEGMAQGIPSARLWFRHLECLFRLGRFDEMRIRASLGYERLVRSGELSAEALRTLEFWHTQGITGSAEGHRP